MFIDIIQNNFFILAFNATSALKIDLNLFFYYTYFVCEECFIDFYCELITERSKGRKNSGQDWNWCVVYVSLNKSRMSIPDD